MEIANHSCPFIVFKFFISPSLFYRFQTILILCVLFATIGEETECKALSDFVNE